MYIYIYKIYLYMYVYYTYITASLLNVIFTTRYVIYVEDKSYLLHCIDFCGIN